MEKIMKRIMAAVMALAMALALASPSSVFAANFGSRFDAKGSWSDTNDFIWSFYDGGSVRIGRGPKFNEMHPEITDPEHYLKEAILYPGEAGGTLNSSGYPKAGYSEEVLSLLQEFVNSFDWIHSDELTRLERIHERIANGKNGNIDQHSGKPIPVVSFSVLQYKIGNCGSYAGEFEKLASYVGLECVQYYPHFQHKACMVKINGQWITVDPFVVTDLFDGNYTRPVDFDAEFNRYPDEVRRSEGYQEQMERAEWWRQVESKQMTQMEYYKRVYPDMSEAEIQEKFFSWDGYVDGLGN